ncbi:MAG: hypothetical protein JWP97_4257 [Labilithrix sp.]|nr:hypothetical protein [Labilithrix sp.]
MTSDCDFDALESLVLGELTAAAAARVSGHATTCAACTGELALLRAERAAFAARAEHLAASHETPALTAVASLPVAVPPVSAHVRSRRLRLVAAPAAVAILALAAALTLRLRAAADVDPALTSSGPAPIAADPAASALVCREDEPARPRLRTSPFACEEPRDPATEVEPRACAASCGRTCAAESVTPAP